MSLCRIIAAPMLFQVKMRSVTIGIAFREGQMALLPMLSRTRVKVSGVSYLVSLLSPLEVLYVSKDDAGK